MTSDGAVHAIDASDGEELWRYEGDDRVSTVGVADGTVYATLAGRVVAYAEGEELWSHEVEGTNSWIRGTAHGNVYFRHASELRVLDADDGKERWSVGFGKEFSTVLGEETVYAGVDDLTAFAPDGTEVWKADLGDSELDGITVTDDHVYAVTEERAHRIDGGEVVSSVDIPGDEKADSHVVGDDGRVYVGTREGVYALGV